jgi:hypothetical protein
MASERPETGPMVFGPDWPGVFVRGDNAFLYQQHLAAVLRALPPEQQARHNLSMHVVEGLLGILQRSHVREGAEGMQQLRPFPECRPEAPGAEAALRTQRDDAYAQRDRLLALLCALGLDLGWDAWMGADAQGEDGFRNVVYLQLPTGQLAFHVPDMHAGLLFAFLPGRTPAGWDGHTNEQKWARVDACVEQLVREPR